LAKLILGQWPKPIFRISQEISVENLVHEFEHARVRDCAAAAAVIVNLNEGCVGRAFHPGISLLDRKLNRQVALQKFSD
jgi:hypothetical protein